MIYLATYCNYIGEDVELKFEKQAVIHLWGILNHMKIGAFLKFTVPGVI